MSIKNSPTFCSMGWTHQFIGPGGNVKPCCRYIDSKLPLGNNVRDNSLEDIFKGQDMDNLRKEFATGIWNVGCRKCWQEESANKRLSIRQNYNRENISSVSDLHCNLDSNNPKITWLELSFSNLCNVRCRTCGPMFSTNWFKDWAIVGSDDVPTPYDYKNKENIEDYISSHKTPLTLDISKLDSCLSTIKHIKMTGGEPFLIPEYKDILKKLIGLGIAKHVYLNYSTNLTIMPSDELINIWKEFKNIEFSTSVDGIGEVYEYQRFPSKWNTAVDVLKKLYSLQSFMNVRVGTRPTISIYNVLDIPNITNFWINLENECANKEINGLSWINHTHLLRPEILSITALPSHLKKIVETRLSSGAPTAIQQKAWNHIINYMYSADHIHLLPRFKDFTLKLDNARNEDMTKIIPEFAELVK